MKQSIKIEIDQQVFVKFNNDKNLRPLTVSKVGTKWVQLTAFEASYHHGYRALIGDRNLESDGCQSPGTIYLSELEYANQCAVASTWYDFRRLVANHTGTPDLTVEQIQYMHRIVEESSK